MKNLKFAITTIIYVAVNIMVVFGVLAVSKWTDFTNVQITFVNESSSSLGKYDLKFENVDFDTDEGTKYYVFISNSSTKPETGESDVEMGNNAIAVWTSETEEKIVPAREMYKFIDNNDEGIYIWIEESKSSGDAYEHHEVLTAKRIEKPALNDITERIDYHLWASMGNFNDIVYVCEPYDNSLGDRSVNLKVGLVTSGPILKNIRDDSEYCYEELLDFAKNEESNMGETTIELAGSNSKSSETIMPFDEMKEDEYYYLYSSINNEEGKYRDIEDVFLFQYLGNDELAKHDYQNIVGSVIVDSKSEDFKWLDSPGGLIEPIPTPSPSEAPSPTPSEQPSVAPSPIPSEQPSVDPSPTPSEQPSVAPSPTPSELPSVEPSPTPSESPSIEPSPTPSESPSIEPSPTPSESPSIEPSSTPSESPSISPSPISSASPSSRPSTSPSISPTAEPSPDDKVASFIGKLPFSGENRINIILLLTIGIINTIVYSVKLKKFIGVK